MGRPTKQGIDFFSLDVNFNDKTEMFLIEKGAVGLAVLVSVWQMIYANNGYYIEDNSDLYLLLKKKIDVDINEISAIIKLCLSRNLFDKSIHKQYGILTSKSIQKRYFDAAKRKKAVSINPDFVLIDVSACNNLVDASINLVDVNKNATKEKEKEKEKEEEEEEEEEEEGKASPPVFSFSKESQSKTKNIILEAWNNFNPENIIKFLDETTLRAINQLCENNKSTFEDTHSKEWFLWLENYRKSKCKDGPFPEQSWYSINNFLRNFNKYVDGPVNEQPDLIFSPQPPSPSPEYTKSKIMPDEEAALIELEKEGDDKVRFYCGLYRDTDRDKIPKKFLEMVKEKIKEADSRIKTKKTRNAES